MSLAHIYYDPFRDLDDVFDDALSARLSSVWWTSSRQGKKSDANFQTMTACGSRWSEGVTIAITCQVV